MDPREGVWKEMIPLRKARAGPLFGVAFASRLLSAAHRDKSREWNVSKRKWNLLDLRNSENSQRSIDIRGLTWREDALFWGRPRVVYP